MSETSTLDMRVIVVLALIMVPLSALLVMRAVALRKKRPWRALTWLFGVVLGATSMGLMVVAAQWKTPPYRQFDWGLEVVRISGLACGVIFVVFAVVAVVPWVLNVLEARSFVPFVSARLVRANKSGFLTVISVLSILGVSVSSCALCCVTSIMGGFGADLQRKILGNTAHIIVDTRHPSGFQQWRPVLDNIRNTIQPHGGAATPVVSGEAMASSATNTAGLLLRGIDPATINNVINLKKNIEIGSFEFLTDPAKLLHLPADAIIGRGPGGQPYKKGPGFILDDTAPLPGKEQKAPSHEDERPVYPGIIVGRELAKSLHVMVGDELTVLSPMGELGPTGIMPLARKFRVAAVFYSGMYEYDASHAYVLLAVAQRIFDLKHRISKIDVRIPEPEKVETLRPTFAKAIRQLNEARKHKVFGDNRNDPLRVRDWKGMNKNLFSALKLEKLATFIILSIAIAVASFCIICTLLLMVTEKTKDIAVLKALGATDNNILRVFILEGMLIGTIGTLLGVSVALAACSGLAWTGVRLDPEVYYIDRLPVNVDLGDYGMVTLAALVICTLATIYPAYTAAQVRPVDGLRYE